MSYKHLMQYVYLSTKQTEGSTMLNHLVSANQSWITCEENTGGTYYALSPLFLNHTVQQPVFYVVFLHDLSEEPYFRLLHTPQHLTT